MKDVKWPDLSGFGARLVVSPANQYRSKTAMLLVNNHEQFKSELEKANPSKSFEQILIDAHFFEVQNEENKYAYYYKNSEKSGIDLNDVKKLFPLFSNDNNVLTSKNDIYLTQLPFSKNFPKWKDYFSLATERFAQYPDVFISNIKSDLEITNVLQDSIVHSNKSFLAQFQATSLPFNRFQDYGYKGIFSKVYLDEESALSNGEMPESLTKTKLSPFSVPLNFENNGSILIIEDLRQLPEIFAYDPIETLNLPDNLNMVHFAHEFETTFSQIIGNIRGNDIFRMSIKDIDSYVQNLADDLVLIDQVFFQSKISYPTFNENIKEQGFPTLYKDESGTWQFSLNGESSRLSDRTFYESLLLRHDFASQIVKQLPNNKVFDSDLNESYLQITSSAIIKFNQLYDVQSSLIKQKELESELNESNVTDILADLDVDFNAVDKENITESDILNIAIGSKEIVLDSREKLKDLLKLPDNILDDRGNDKVRNFAPSMLEIRQILDVYVIPKAKERVQEIELQYSNFLNEKYEALQNQIKLATNNNTFDPNTISNISEEIDSFNFQLSEEYNNAKRILWESEALVHGVTSGTNTFLFNKDSFYYKKDKVNQFVKFESEIEIKQHKAELYKLLSVQFDDQLISATSKVFTEFVNNNTAIDMLISRINPYVELNISDTVSTIDNVVSEPSDLKTTDLFNTALLNNDRKAKIYREEFTTLLSRSNFDEDFLNQALKKTSNYNLLKYGVYDALFQSLIIPQHESSSIYKRKGESNNIPDDVFAKTSSYTDGFSIDRHFNRFVEIQSFSDVLNLSYPNQDWTFITADPEGKNAQSVMDDMLSDYRDDQKDISDIHSAIERQFYKKNTTLFAVNKNLAANEIFVQYKVNGRDNDLSMDIINENSFDPDIHYKLSSDPYKATVQLYANIANHAIEKTLYLDDGDLEKAKFFASLLISENEKTLKEESLKLFGVELNLEDFKLINSIKFENDKLNLNGNEIANIHYNNIQIYNFLNLVDINKRSLFGKFDIDVSEDFKSIKDLLRPNIAFQKNVKYFAISPQEENIQFSTELEYFDKQLENALKIYEDENGPIVIPNNNIYMYSLNKGDIQYLRLYDNNDKSMPYISYGISLDANIYKASGFSDRESVKTSINVFYKFGSKNSPSYFMPPSKFTFEKYYDSDLNYFKAKSKDKTLANQIFTSIPSNLFDYMYDSPSIHGIKPDFRSNRHSEIYDNFEDLAFDKKTKEVSKILSDIDPTYSYVMAHVDGQTAIIPKNLTTIFEIDNFTEIHPFDLLNPKIQKNDLVDLFAKGFEGNPDTLLAKMKYNIVLGRIGNPEKATRQPRFFNEQQKINQDFEVKYTALSTLEEIDALLIDHVVALQETLQQAYLERFPGSTPSKHHYSLLNRKGISDTTPQLYLVDRNYEEFLAGELLSVAHPEFGYVNVQGFTEPKDYKYEIITNLKAKANLGSHFENIALSNLPSHKIRHKDDYLNKQLASLQYHTLITNTLSTLYSKVSDIKQFISESNSKLVLGHKPATDSDYSTFKLFKDSDSLDDGFKTLCVFPLKALNSVEDVLQIQKIAFSDFTFIENLVPKVAYEPDLTNKNDGSKPSDNNVPSYLGDVGKKFGGAHKDRYGEYISLEYISSTSADQTATDYRKAKIIANKEFQLWYSNTKLDLDDKIFVKAMYDYCPPKPLFSKNALLMDSLRAIELKAYVKVVSNIKNLMVDTQAELLTSIKNTQHLSASSLEFTDRQRRDYIGLYSKGTKHNYKNYFEILCNLDNYYIGPEHTGGISVQLEKILEKTIDKEFSNTLSTGKIFDFYSKLKVSKDVSDAISNMQRTGLYSPVLEPYVLKNAIETGIVKAEADPIYVNEPVKVEKENITDNIESNKAVNRQPKVPSFTSNIIQHESGYITEQIKSDIYGLLNFSRTGPNLRSGEDVDSFNLKNTFDISGVEVGNKVSPVAQQLVNAVYDSFNDLKVLMGFKSNEGLLNVGVALASRGIKGSAAHYELTKNVVNLTRDNGAGSLAHEYAHALDAYLGTMEKAEVYKQQSHLSRSILQEYYEDIPNFEIPNARHFLSQMLDKGYNPMTESGQAFEKLYRAMSYQPVEEMQNFGVKTKDKAEDIIKQYYNILDKCIDEVTTHKSAYQPTDRKTLDNFFDWHEGHYTNLIHRQFDKVEEYLKKYQNEYINDDNLSFFRTVRDKVDLIVSKINTDINSLSFKSFERHQERWNDQRAIEYHLPIVGIEEKVNKIFTAADVNLSQMSSSLAEYLSELSKNKFYTLVEKYMPEGVQDPHTQMEAFFNKTNSSSPKGLDSILFSDVISRYKEDCLNMDRSEGRATPYYGTSTEMFARYFETYLYSKILVEKDISNSFLIDGYPQVKPKGLEFEICNKLTDKLVQTCVKEVFDKDLLVNQELQIASLKTKENDSENLDLTI